MIEKLISYATTSLNNAVKTVKCVGTGKSRLDKQRILKAGGYYGQYIAYMDLLCAENQNKYIELSKQNEKSVKSVLTIMDLIC